MKLDIIVLGLLTITLGLPAAFAEDLVVNTSHSYSFQSGGIQYSGLVENRVPDPEVFPCHWEYFINTGSRKYPEWEPHSDWCYSEVKCSSITAHVERLLGIYGSGHFDFRIDSEFKIDPKSTRTKPVLTKKLEDKEWSQTEAVKDALESLRRESGPTGDIEQILSARNIHSVTVRFVKSKLAYIDRQLPIPAVGFENSGSIDITIPLDSKGHMTDKINRAFLKSAVLAEGKRYGLPRAESAAPVAVAEENPAGAEHRD